MSVYRVEVTKTLYVVADDCDDAESVALDHYEDEDGPDMVNVTSVVEVKQGSKLPNEIAESIPWGGDDERTIGDRLAQLEIPS